MLLKRHYDMPEDWEPKRDPQGNLLNRPPISHVEIKNTGGEPEQHFSRRLVEGGMMEGWISLSRGKMILHAQPEDLTYTVKRTPGYYCCYCGVALSGDMFGTEQKAHVEALHAGAENPDPSNPHGYERIEFFDVVLNETQHEMYKLR